MIDDKRLVEHSVEVDSTCRPTVNTVSSKISNHTSIAPIDVNHPPVTEAV